MIKISKIILSKAEPEQGWHSKIPILDAETKSLHENNLSWLKSNYFRLEHGEAFRFIAKTNYGILNIYLRSNGKVDGKLKCEYYFSSQADVKKLEKRNNQLVNNFIKKMRKLQQETEELSENLKDKVRTILPKDAKIETYDYENEILYFNEEVLLDALASNIFDEIEGMGVSTGYDIEIKNKKTVQEVYENLEATIKKFEDKF